MFLLGSSRTASRSAARSFPSSGPGCNTGGVEVSAVYSEVFEREALVFGCNVARKAAQRDELCIADGVLMFRLRGDIRFPQDHEVEELLLPDITEQAAHCARRRVNEVIVDANELRHTGDFRIAEAKPVHDISHDGFACLTVSVEAEMASIFFELCALRLGNVMDESRKAEQRLVRWDAVDNMEAVLPHVVDVPKGLLVESDSRRQFRDDLRDDRLILPQDACRVLSREDTEQLFTDALIGDVVEKPTKCEHRVFRLRFDDKPISRGKAHSAQDTERVFREALSLVAHTADDAKTQVCLPAEWVDDVLARRIRHSVDGEVSAGEVFFYVRHEFDGIRVPVVTVGAVLTGTS